MEGGSKDALRKGRRQAEEGLDDAGRLSGQNSGLFLTCGAERACVMPLCRGQMLIPPVRVSQESLVNIVSQV